MDIHEYTVTLRHDGGVFRIRTAATSAEAAKGLIVWNEMCPASAVLEVRDHGPVEAERQDRG